MISQVRGTRESHLSLCINGAGRKLRGLVMVFTRC